MAVRSDGRTRAGARSGGRTGSLVLVLLSAATLVAVHAWPGWAAVVRVLLVLAMVGGAMGVGALMALLREPRAGRS